MKYRDIQIVSRTNGETVPARLFQCDECNGETFIIYQVGNHPHLQCTKCGTSHCQGDCPGAEQLQLSRQ